MVLTNREKQARYRERLKARSVDLEAMLTAEIEACVYVLSEIERGVTFYEAEGDAEMREVTAKRKVDQEARLLSLQRKLSAVRGGADS